MKPRINRIRSPSRRVREAEDMAGGESVRGGPGTRARGRTPRSRSQARRASTRGTQRPRGRPTVASRAVERETVQADLGDSSDASVNPRDIAAAPGTPSLMDMFDLEDQERAERAVSELEQIECQPKRSRMSV